VALGHARGEWNAKPSYTLGHLISPDFTLATDPEDAVTVSIRRLRLHAKHSRRRITLEADPEAGPADIYRMMGEVLNKQNVPPSSVFVGLVTFCFEFGDADGRRAGSMTFDVAFPSSCSLRNHRPEYIEMAQKYLKRWRIDGGIAPAATPPAAGS
jgi:hypothetical protein